jgi:hypothetical protein
VLTGSTTFTGRGGRPLATSAIATTATRPQAIWTGDSSCRRITSAATAATGALRIEMTDETEASTKRWAQFTITCPTPGTIARATIHGQSLAGMAVKDSPDASATGVMATAAAIQTPAMNSKLGIWPLAFFANSQ